MDLLYDDNKKIGMGLIILGSIFYFIGVLWFLDRGFLCIGVQNAAGFFFKKNNILGSIFYFGGFLSIIIGWYFMTLLGFCLQVYGFFHLFKSFFKKILSFSSTLPVIGPIIRNSPWLHDMVDRVSSDSSNGAPSSSYSKKFDV